MIVLICLAAAPLQATEDLAPGSRPLVAFPKGTWDVEARGSYAWEFYPYDHEKLATGSVGIGYCLADNFSATLSVPVSHVHQFTHDATMVGLDLSLRYHFLQTNRFTLFTDLTGGLAQSNRIVPPGGTYFNFTAELGLGATYRLSNQFYLVGGLHYFHLSNAAIHGINHNPDLNAAQPYLGVMFRF